MHCIIFFIKYINKVFHKFLVWRRIQIIFCQKFFVKCVSVLLILNMDCYYIARLSVSNDAAGQLIGRFPTSGNPATAVSFTFAVPEPASTLLVCAGLGALALRRRPAH